MVEISNTVMLLIKEGQWYKCYKVIVHAKCSQMLITIVEKLSIESLHCILDSLLCKYEG